MADITKTQFFTSNWDFILKNINFKPDSAVDPFAGNCDLVDYSPDTSWELYDIDVKKPEVKYNDSLLNPIDYHGKNVITNPPYLAKNKTKEFSDIFEKYSTDDLYKASILSIMDCEQGILIIPINFFTDENTKDVRTKFLNTFKVEYVNYFIRPVFKDTTYNVCSFYFKRGKTNNVVFYNPENDSSFTTELKEEFNYRVGGEFYKSIEIEHPIFTRARTGRDNKGLTNIFINCIDKRGKGISASYNTNTYLGIDTDRVFATLCCEKELTEEQQKILIEKFNYFLEESRAKYNNLILTNYRDFGRKRIGYDDAYKIFTKLYNELFH